MKTLKNELNIFEITEDLISDFSALTETELKLYYGSKVICEFCNSFMQSINSFRTQIKLNQQKFAQEEIFIISDESDNEEKTERKPVKVKTFEKSTDNQEIRNVKKSDKNCQTSAPGETFKKPKEPTVSGKKLPPMRRMTITNVKELLKRSTEITKTSRLKKSSSLFECTECDKKYKNRNNFKDHQEIVHKNIRLHCVYPACEKTFSTQKGIREHITRKHPDVSKDKVKSLILHRVHKPPL